MFQQLGNPEYVHILLNPLPVYGLATGLLALVIALLSRARAARVTAMSVIFLCALSAWPVSAYGEKAYDRVLAMADADGGQWLHEHMARVDKLIPLFYVTAACAAFGLIAEFKIRRAAVPVALLTLLLTAATLGAGGYIAYAGGRIRHREFRYTPPPPQKSDEATPDH